VCGGSPEHTHELNNRDDDSLLHSLLLNDERPPLRGADLDISGLRYHPASSSNKDEVSLRAAGQDTLILQGVGA
jgi:hypothetical protein